MTIDAKTIRMISQGMKDFYYLLLYPLSRMLCPVYRFYYQMKNDPPRKVHIGSSYKMLPGFVNIDGNFQRGADCTLDVRAGLPFPDESIEFIYSCHMMEHIHIYEAIVLLRECRRVLRAGGYLHLTLPDFNYVFDILHNGALATFPRSFKSKEGQAINWLFCDGQHKYAYTHTVVAELAEEAGFARIEAASLDDPHIPNLIEDPGASFSVNLYK
jgi:predicted SAM-dependent methyltransferase